MNTEISDEINCRTGYCYSWDELMLSLLDKPISIMIHINTFTKMNVSIDKFVSMLNTLTHCVSNNLKLNIGVAIEPTTTQEIVSELLQNNILCIAPSYGGFGKDECFPAIKALVDTGIYIPKHIISKLPGSPNKLKLSNKFCLTERQKEVLSLVCNRGLSNKKIASTLHISESTVKIHISAILKEYGVRNRTQLVLAATSALKA